MKPLQKDYKKKDNQDLTKKNKKIKIIQFLNIADNSHHPSCAVDVDEPIFQPEPQEILFQDYEPLQILTRILKLRNRDIVPRKVSIIHPENRLFQVVPYKKSIKSSDTNDLKGNDYNLTGESANTKVAPGMEVSYYIKFTPEAKVDVYYELIVITEREKFVVPIRGIGCKVKLEFMDFINFGEVPVKYKVEKPIILRNVGEKITKWMLKSSSQNISVSKKEGILDVGKSEQIICTFCPQEERLYSETMILSYDEDNAEIKIFGKSKNDDVLLSDKAINLEDAYITLHSQSLVYIINNTSVPIDFVWKQYASEEKEREAKRKVFDNLNQQEAQEKILNELQYDYQEAEGEEHSSIDLDDSYDDEEKVKILERNHMKSQNIIARRFEKIKKSLNEDQMCYENPNFQIEPLSGKIWPNTRMAINITFKPEQARKYESEAFCDVTGLDKRLKLEMSGLGIGPKAKLSFYDYDLFDVAITSEIDISKKFTITNIGVIECEFEIESPNTPCARQIIFQEKRGKLPPRGEKENGEMNIPIKFKAERLGEFSERFKVRILKSGHELPIIFKGHVIAPFCKFSKERIDFEKVSLGLDKKESVDLINVSDVDITYKLRISTDAKDANNISTIFIIDKTEGVLPKSGEPQRINIAFKPEDERSYDIVILLDMVNIGFDMLTLPVTAVCEIPEVIITPNDLLDFEDVFIREEKWKTITLTNTSSTLTALFQVNPQDDPSKAWGLLFTETESGQIPPDGTFVLNVGIKALRLQKIPLKLEIKCKTKNSNKDSSYITTINVMAISNGPTVTVDKNIQELDFGGCRVLKPKKEIITLYNSSPIDAVYTAFMKNPNSIFTIANKTGKINKKSTCDIEIICKPDEAQRFNESLYFKIDEGKDFEIQLKCRGEGTTIVIPNDDIKEINFGTIFTFAECEKLIRFENRGRSDQIIAWNAVKIKKRVPQDPQNRNNQNNNNNRRNQVEEEEKTFTVVEQRGLIRSKKFGFFKIKAFSRTTGILSDDFAIHNWRDGENNGPKVWDCKVIAEFINPSLLPTPSKLHFVYSYQKDVDVETVPKTLVIKNTAKLQAQFNVIVPPPFSINKDKFVIEPDESDSLVVEFDPSTNKEKRKIDKFTKTLFFQHTNHEQKDALDLVVSINFPNLKELPSELYFGCLLNDTITRKTLTLESDSDLEVVYEWILIEVDNSYEAMKKKKEARRIPLNEVFGIVPMNGRLKKGDVETVEITFTPGMNQRYTVIARCLVKGGPIYDVKLIGEASEIKYKIIINEESHEMSKKEIIVPFGEVPFNVASRIDMTIKNDGEVPFSYKINYNTDKMRYLSLSSYYDQIPKNESKKIVIEIIPGIPDKLDDEIIIEIAHFEPIKAKIKAIGIYQGILISLNRKEPEFNERMKEVENYLDARKKKLLEYMQPIKKILNIKKNVLPEPKKINNVLLNPNAEYELEVNRDNLCKKLIDKMSKAELLGNNGGNSSANINGPARERRTNALAVREAQLAAFLKETKIATYTCDFGNIVANKKGELKFNVYNYNKQTIQLIIDKKEMATLGYTVTTNNNNDKVFIEPNSFMTIGVTHDTTSKNLNNIKNILKLVMKDEEVYEIELNSFVTIPDLKLSSSLIDFERCYIGRKKIMRFRIENITRVQTQWTIINKDNPPKQSEREERREDKEVFSIFPSSGKLEAGKKQTLSVYFVPGKEKIYQSKYNFTIVDGARPIEFFIRGEGQRLALKILNDNVDIGPVLPYYKYALNVVEFINPNDTDIEIYSLDFDDVYLKEEDNIRYYKTFAKNANAAIDMPIREASQELWPKFTNYYNKWSEKVEDIKKKIQISNSPSNDKIMNLLNEKLLEKTFDDIEEEDEIKVPPAIDENDRYNIILIGPDKSGKTSLCKDQRKEHFRGIINMSSIYEWNIQNHFKETIEKAKLYLDERKKELEALKAEREKLIKQARTNRKIKVDDTPIDEKKYTYLSKEIMIELIQNRLTKKDCNIGVIIEDFHNIFVENEEVLLEIVDEVFKNENLILAYFDFPRDDNQQEVCNYIDWNKIHTEMNKDKRPKKAINSGINNQPVIKKPVITLRRNAVQTKEKRSESVKEPPKKTIVVKDIAQSQETAAAMNLLMDSGIVINQNNFKFPSPKKWTEEEKVEYFRRRDILIEKMIILKEERDRIFEENKYENPNINSIEPNNTKFENIVSSGMINISKPPTNTSIIRLSNTNLPKIPLPVERLTQRVEYEYYLPQLLQAYMNCIPAPKLPDPEEMPIPPDEQFQIIKRPLIRQPRFPISSFFLKSVNPEFEHLSLEEIIQLLIEEDKRLEEFKLKEAQAAKEKIKKTTAANKNVPGKDTKTQFLEPEYKPKQILVNKSRFVIKKNEKVRAIVGFFSKEVGKKVQPLSFEIMTYPPIEYKITLNGIADYPSLSTLPSNIKMTMPGTIGLLNRKKNYEENFGNILITKDDRKNNDKFYEKYKDTNCKLLRFTNNGKFDLRVDFVFLSSLNFEGLGFPLPTPLGASDMNSSGPITVPKGNKNAITQPEPPTPFLLVNNYLEIKKEQTEILQVYAFPNRTVEYKDELICLIKDNPIPIRINLTCKGSEPRVDLENDVIEFDKLIVNQALTRQIKLKNMSEVTCKWHLNGTQNIPNQFKFDATHGVIERGREIYINVTFCSEKQEKYNFTLTMDIEDNTGYGVKMPTRTIKFTAEAFEVNVELSLNKDKIINFGDVKVRDYKKHPFSLKNSGIYRIRYKFEIGKKYWQELFKFEPSEGEIEPGKERNMLAIFLPHPRDINISPSKNGTEIKLLIFEGEKIVKHQEISIYVNVASYFSKYTINPPKTLTFEALQYGNNSSRSIEIRNEGTFDFTYDLMEYLDEPRMKKLKEEKDLKELEEQKLKEQEMREELEGMGKGGKTNANRKIPNQQQPKNNKKVEDVLKIGKFTISNYKGNIAPGSSAKIDIRFDAEGNKTYHSPIAIDIQGRHPDDNPLGIPFDLTAESCIPGIETKDFDNIFEEQTVLPSLNPEVNRQSVITSGLYSIEEKVFWFGTIIASKNPNGVTERFKIINNNKIPCNVKVEVRARTSSKSEGNDFFEVSHKIPLIIPSNESEYVSVTFKPTKVIPCSAIFEAKVVGGELNPETGKLVFEMRGEGTLPTILLYSPTEYDTDGTPVLKFKKTRLTKTSTSQILLKNDGVVPATVKFEPISNPNFTFLSSTTATIQPKIYQTFDIQFEPKIPNIEKAILQYKTLFNQFENPRIYLVGEGFFEPISIDNLDNENEMNFGDVCVGDKKTISFNIMNHSDNSYRFNWLNIYEPSLEIVPSAGIILPHMTMKIDGNFCSKESIKLLAKDLYVELKQIKFTNNISEWDNSMKTVRKVTQSEYDAILIKKQEDATKRKDEMEFLINTITGNKNKSNANAGQKKDQTKKKDDKNVPAIKEEPTIEIEEVIPEPQYTIVEKSEKYNSVKVSGVCDYAKYQCPTQKIKFKPTTMYATRKHEFQLRNTSLVNIHFNFNFVNPNPIVNNTNNINISNHMITSQEKTDAGPYTISPKSGVIPAGTDEIITIRFCPNEVDDYNFKRIVVCHIRDLDPNLPELQIELTGEAERPICHFELQEGIRQENGLFLIGYESIGMMVKNTKRFFVLNPTNQGYEFEWEQPDEELIPSINRVFKCLTPKGVIYSGKKYEMIFEYTPNTLGNQESFWTFKINSDIEKLVQKFVFKGVCREPMILFNTGKVNFGPLLLGGRNKEVIEIINEEHIPYKFNFEKESIKGNNTYGDSLIVSPIAGTLQPKSSTPIEITFMPRVEKEFNYNLILKVKQRLKPLTLNVKGVGYTISHGVYLDNKPELRLISKQEHVIEFGEFFINEKRERTIYVENNGSFNFHYAFKKNGADYLKITPESGTVKKTERLPVVLTLIPLNKLNLQNHKIIMQLVSGPTYTFLINAKARSPQIIFSSVSCNFGQCYVMRSPVPTTQIITVKNMDKEALTIETNFDNKNKSYLDVLLSTGQVILPYTSPQDVLEIPIVFNPREFMRYRDVLKFKFNGIYDVEVEVTGEGIPLRVELEDPSLQTLNFGIIQLGQSKKMEFVVVNRGKIKVNIQLYPENSSMFSKRCLSMNIKESESFTIEPKGSIRVEVQFNPNIRIPSIQEDILMKINNTDEKRLITVTGASYGVDVKMVGDIPPFGTVVVDSMAMRQVLLRNSGDLPARFKWEQPTNPKKDYTKFFTISPYSGLIPPHEDVQLDIIFHPKVVNNNISFEKIKCYIENFEPLFITLYGKSIAIPNESITQAKIYTEVRVPYKHVIKVKNPTDKPWRITPSISTSDEQFISYFKGDHIFEIKQGFEGLYELTYLPLTMSKQPNTTIEKEHEATVFFPLPEGLARVEKVVGIATAPKAKQIININTKAREWCPIKLEISNWLYHTQRFKVSWITDKTDHGIFVKWADTIDVASNTTKEYKLSFRSWKEMQCVLTLTFENVETKEYVFYLLNITVTTADPNPVTELVGVVRESITSTITITNPLKIPVTIQPSQIIIENDYVSIKPNTQFTIIAESEMPIEVTYRPLTVNQTTANIIIKTQELGELKYPLLLKGTSNPPLKQIQPIVAYLGSDKIVTLSFTNYLRKLTTYTVKVEKLYDNFPNPVDFIPDPAVIQADPTKGSEINVSVRFEPYFIGESKAILKVASPDGGEYSWILIGESHPPQAQGPLKILANKTFNLDFKNPLNEPVEIIARFDNPNFFLAGKLNSRLEPKPKSVQIPIGYKPGQDQLNTGRLIITLNKLPPWVYYLQAE